MSARLQKVWQITWYGTISRCCAPREVALLISSSSLTPSSFYYFLSIHY